MKKLLIMVGAALALTSCGPTELSTEFSNPIIKISVFHNTDMEKSIYSVTGVCESSRSPLSSVLFIRCLLKDGKWFDKKIKTSEYYRVRVEQVGIDTKQEFELIETF